MHQPYSRADRNRVRQGVIPRRVVGRCPSWWSKREPISRHGVAAAGALIALPGTPATAGKRIMVTGFGTSDQQAGFLESHLLDRRVRSWPKRVGGAAR